MTWVILIFCPHQIQAVVDSYKGANISISQSCKYISEHLLIKIDSKKVYENLEFDEDQSKHRAAVQKKLHQLHDDIIRIMKQTFEVFRSDGAEVRRHKCYS